MNLGEAISICRKQKGLTIDELVEKSGVPKGTLNKITNGITLSPKIETVRAIANALDMRMEDFERMCEKEPPPRNYRSRFEGGNEDARGIVSQVRIHPAGTGHQRSRRGLPVSLDRPAQRLVRAEQLTP